MASSLVVDLTQGDDDDDDNGSGEGEDDVVYCGEARRQRVLPAMFLGSRFPPPAASAPLLLLPRNGETDEIEGDEDGDVEIVEPPPTRRQRRQSSDEDEDEVIVLASKPLAAQLAKNQQQQQQQQMQRRPSEVLETDAATCPICFASPPDSETATTVCTHRFCHTCIDTWLSRYAKVCPVCKRPLHKADLVSID